MNHHSMPPVPPAHFPPSHPGEPPRVIHHPTPVPADTRNGVRFMGHNPAEPTIINQMGRLNIDGDAFPRGRGNMSQGKPGKGVPPLDPSTTTPVYEGWTFYKAEPDTPGQKQNWTRANKMQMHLSQNDLSTMVQKRIKKIPASEQYQALSKFKRAHVDRLIEDRSREQNDPRFEWSCVYVDVDEKSVKGKGARRGDYETVSMDVVIMKKLRPGVTINQANALYPESSFGELVDLDAPIKAKERNFHKLDNHIIEVEPRPINRSPGNNAQWTGAGIAQQTGGPNPATVNAAHQPIPPQFHQHHPTAPGPGHFVGGQPPMPNHIPQGQRHQIPPGGAQPLPRMPGNMGGGYGGVPSTEIPHGGARGPPGGPETWRPASRPGRQHTPFAPIPPQLDKPEHLRKPNFPDAKVVNPARPVKSPRLPPDHEAEWLGESSSVEDDESVLFDPDDESSATEDFDDEIFEKPRAPRGSLHQRQRSPKQNRQEPVYRAHYRKQPSKNKADGKVYRNRYPSGHVDLIPENSMRARREAGRLRGSGDLSLQGLRSRPKIVNHGDRNDLQERVGPVALNADSVLEHTYRDRRSLEDRIDDQIRGRILEDREEHLRRRERDLDYRARKIEEKLDEARFLDRHVSIREPRCHSPYGYRSRDGVYY